MKTKHFCGYGTVETSVTKRMQHNNNIMLQIQVIGSHERGLTCCSMDKYDVYNWLVRRHLRKCTSYEQITNFTAIEVSSDMAIYTINIDLNKK